MTLQNGARIDAGTGVDHVARLTRLTPGRRYAYTVGTDVRRARRGARSGPRRPAPRRFTFAVVGDFGSGNRNETAVASLIESWHPDFVLTVGDNAYPLGSAALLDRAIFGPYAAVMRGRPGSRRSATTTSRRTAGSPSSTRSTRSATSAGTASPGGTPPWWCWTPTSPSPPARRSCASHAAPSRCRPASASPPGTTRPGSPRATRISPGLRRNIVPLVEQNGVQVVFEGHLHAYARSRPHHGVLYVAVGHGRSRARRRRRRPDDPVRTRRPRPLRRPAGGRRRSHGALPLPDGRRHGARRLPRDLLLIRPLRRPLTDSNRRPLLTMRSNRVALQPVDLHSPITAREMREERMIATRHRSRRRCAL